MKNLTKKISLAVLSTSLAFGISSNYIKKDVSAAADSNRIVIAGSTALLPLTNQAAKEFKKSNPKVKVSISGSSSVAGPQAVLKGSATIGACDWDASQDVADFNAFKGVKTYAVAATPFATIVNKSNPVSNLSTAQLQDIYSGKITNWKQVGGADHDITVVVRKIGSGTRVNYQAKALKGGKIMTSGDNLKLVGKSGDMKTAVSTDNYAIGFIDLAYVKGDIKALAYNGVSATIGNVKNGKYPIWAYGYLVTKGEATGANKKFIDYMRSSKFQNGSLASLKFVPLKSIKK
jgi:phosphate transport system substrate-binding protein